MNQSRSISRSSTCNQQQHQRTSRKYFSRNFLLVITIGIVIPILLIAVTSKRIMYTEILQQHSATVIMKSIIRSSNTTTIHRTSDDSTVTAMLGSSSNMTTSTSIALEPNTPLQLRQTPSTTSLIGNTTSSPILSSVTNASKRTSTTEVMEATTTRIIKDTGTTINVMKVAPAAEANVLEINVVEEKPQQNSTSPTTTRYGFVVLGMHRSGTSMLSGILVHGFGYTSAANPDVELLPPHPDVL